MTYQKTSKRAVVFCMGLLVAGMAQAGVIYQDTFSTDGSLAGRPVEIGTGTWIGHSNLQTTGGVALPAADGPGKNALLAFTPEVGKVYTLSANVNAVSGSWLGIGFVSDTALNIVGNEFFHDYVDTPAPWMYVVPNDNVQTFFGPHTGGVAGYVGVGSSGGTMAVELDTTGSDWVAKYLFDGATLRTYTFSGSLNITHVGFGGNPVSSQEVDNFSLTVIPEPATLGLVAVMGGAVLFIRRRLMM